MALCCAVLCFLFVAVVPCVLDSQQMEVDPFSQSLAVRM